jgi:hypothetical protein
VTSLDAARELLANSEYSTLTEQGDKVILRSPERPKVSLTAVELDRYFAVRHQIQCAPPEPAILMNGYYEHALTMTPEARLVIAIHVMGEKIGEEISANADGEKGCTQSSGWVRIETSMIVRKVRLCSLLHPVFGLGED